MKLFAETERLFLRELLPSDADGMWELDSDPEVHRYLGNNPVTDREKILEVIAYVRQQYVDHGIGRWAIIDKQTNDFIGWSGLKFVTEQTNNHQNFYDLGYRIKRKYWRQGIATETAFLALDYAFDTMQLPEVFAAAHVDNVGSNKILQKVGMQLMNTFMHEDIACHWYHITPLFYDLQKKKS